MRAAAWTILAVCALTAIAAGARAGERVALIIGNGAYENAPSLKNPVADAEALAAKLETLGFEVHKALDATQSDLLDVVSEFTDALSGAEAALFYYSGHGLQLGDENYLLPVDIEARNEMSVRYGAIGVSDIVADIERNADVTVVVLDACRDNPFAAELQRAAGSTRSVAVSRGLARIHPTTSGTIIAYAAAAGDVASDGEGDHSPYTSALLAEIDRPGAEVGLIFRRVAGRVIDETGGDQRPELLVRLTREFYFSAPEVVDVAAPPGAEVQETPSGGVQPVAEDGETDQPAAADDGVSTQTVAAAEPAAESAVLQQVRQAYSPARWGYYAALAAPAIVPPRTPWVPAPGMVRPEGPGNDSIVGADWIGANDTLRLSIHPRGDHDWASLTVEQAGMLTLTATGMPAEIDLAARVLDGDLGTVANWTAAPRPGGDFYLAADLPAPGNYLIEIADGSNDGESTAGIDLALAFVPSPDLYEPNNTIGEARAVPISDVRTGAILPLGDADWFTVASDTPGELVLEATDVPEELDIALRVLDADAGTVLNWTTGPRPGGDTYAIADLARPGIYSIEVRDGSNNARSERPYTLATSFTPSVDPGEPNDTVGTAYPIAIDTELALTIFPIGDADWLEVNVDQPGALEISATEVPQELDVAFRVLDADGATVVNWITGPRPGGDTLATADFGRPGRYRIEVRDGSNNARSIEPFRFETRFTPAADQYEPNDSFGTARPLTPGGAIAFNILPLGDADWFRVTVDTPGALAIAIDEGPPELDIHFRVLNSDQGTVVNWTAPYAPGGLTEGVADLPIAGTYYIELRDGSNNARSVQHATLFTTFTPLVASYEPNNTRGQATEVALAGETYAHILPQGDADWFRILVDQPGDLDIEIDQVAETLDVAFRVLDANSGTVTNWVSAPRPGGVTTGTASFSAPGVYYIEVRDGSNDARDPAPFRIRRTFRPAG